jgi:hypothetical protein
MLSWLRKEWPGALLLSLLLGGVLLGLLPWLPAWTQAQGPHAVLPINAGIDAVMYQGQYRDIYEGKWLAGDTPFHEHRAEVGAWPPLLFGLYGKLGRLLGSLNAGIATVWFLAWTASFLLVYILLRTFIPGRAWALAGTLLVLGAESFIRNPLLIPADLFLYPQRHAVEIAFLFLPFFLLWRAAATGSIRKAVIAGITGGLAFYIYIYHALLFVAGAIAAILFFWPRRKACLTAAGTALAVSLPYWLLKLSFDRLPTAADWYARVGLTFTHTPTWGQSGILLAGLVLFLLIAWRRWSALASLTAAFLLASIGLMNLQVIIGKTLQPGHWFLHSGRMLLALAGIHILSVLGQQRPFSRLNGKALGGAALAVMLLFAGISQARAAVRDASHWTVDPAYADALAWLDREAAGSVVVSPAPRTNGLTTALTSNYAFTGPGVSSLASRQELIERLTLAFRLYGAAPERVRAFLDTGSSRAEHVGGNIYTFGGTYVFAIETPDDRIPPDVLDGIIRDYCRLNPRELLGKYRMDYAVDGPLERELTGMTLAGRNGLAEAYRNGEVVAYRIDTAAALFTSC